MEGSGYYNGHYSQLLTVANREELKKRLTLPLDGNKSNKKSSDILSSPDVHRLKFSSPEVEKFLHTLQQTPTPNLAGSQSHMLFSQQHAPTERQEEFVKGFDNVLEELRQGDASNSDAGQFDEYSHSLSNSPTDITNHSGSSNSQMGLDRLKEEPMNCVSPIDMEAQEKYKLERKRQRNRVAASKCRKRKLERIAKLEDKVRQLKSENSDLSSVVHRLKEDVCALKEEVMQHASYGCQILLTSNF